MTLKIDPSRLDIIKSQIGVQRAETEAAEFELKSLKQKIEAVENEIGHVSSVNPMNKTAVLAKDEKLTELRMQAVALKRDRDTAYERMVSSIEKSKSLLLLRSRCEQFLGVSRPSKTFERSV